MSEQNNLSPEVVLLPCPFCGAEPYVIEDDSYDNCFVGCNCLVTPCVSDDKTRLDKVKAKWNERTSVPPPHISYTIDAKVVESSYDYLTENKLLKERIAEIDADRLTLINERNAMRNDLLSVVREQPSVPPTGGQLADAIRDIHHLLRIMDDHDAHEESIDNDVPSACRRVIEKRWASPEPVAANKPPQLSPIGITLELIRMGITVEQYEKLANDLMLSGFAYCRIDADGSHTRLAPGTVFVDEQPVTLSPDGAQVGRWTQGYSDEGGCQHVWVDHYVFNSESLVYDRIGQLCAVCNAMRDAPETGDSNG